MYSETVIKHYRSPLNVGELPDADGVGVYLSETCGDVTFFYIKVEEDRIKDVRFKTQGCAASIASGSMLSQMAKGKTLGEALKISKDDVASALGGLPEVKIHCSLLATDALADAVYDYLKRRGLEIPRELVEKHEKVRPQLEKLQEMGYIPKI